MAVIRLDKSLAAWGTPVFRNVAKAEIEALDGALLPLQEGLSRSSYVSDGKVGAVILGGEEDAALLRIKAGLFYAGIIAGCSCADDPTPIDEITEYCEVLFGIDKFSGAVSVTLIGT
jgi:hypothetical protein